MEETVVAAVEEAGEVAVKTGKKGWVILGVAFGTAAVVTGVVWLNNKIKQGKANKAETSAENAEGTEQE